MPEDVEDRIKNVVTKINQVASDSHLEDMEVDQLNIRRISKSVKRDVKASAQARGLTIGQYVGRLVFLHRLALEAGISDELLDMAGLGKVKV